MAQMKGEDRAILVTDSISATGMPDGTYKLGNLTVEVANNTCILEGTQTLAGSVLTMDHAIANLQRITGAPLSTALRLASHNPANLLGLPPSPNPRPTRQLQHLHPRRRSEIHHPLRHPQSPDLNRKMLSSPQTNSITSTNPIKQLTTSNLQLQKIYFPKAVFSYVQSCKIELEKEKGPAATCWALSLLQ